MFFTRAKNTDDENLIISTKNGANIYFKKKCSYLTGIWTDEKVAIEHHVTRVVCILRGKRLFSSTGIKPLCFRQMLNEASSLSVLDYGDILHMHASAATLKPLDAVYHSALRFITGDNYNTHLCELYAKVGWPSLSVSHDRYWISFIYKKLFFIRILPFA